MPNDMLGFLKSFKFTKKPTGSYGPAGLLAADEEDEKKVIGEPGLDNPEDEARALLVDNPKISAPTYFNLLKSKGLTIVKEAKRIHEADSSSANVASVRAGVNATWSKKYPKSIPKAKAVIVKKESVKQPLTFLSKFTESSAVDNGVGFTKFRVVLIQEGLGNLTDAYYYSRQALESAVAVFEGKKIYADHPTAIEDQTRPERSVKDVLGHFENVAFEEHDGQGQLVGDVVVLPDDHYRWARSLMSHSIEYAKKYPDKEFIGLSINASGSAEEMPLDKVLEGNVPEASRLKLEKAKNEGIETVRYVSVIENAVSCDLVTEAGAGGKVLEMIEKEKR